MTFGAALLCAAALSMSGTATAPASLSHRASVKVYKMHRPGLRVRLQVQGRVIFPTRVWARTRCNKSGFEGGSALTLAEPTPSQEIAIDRKGRFEYIFPRQFGERTRLGGHVYDRSIKGYYLEWEFDGFEVCGTGQPGNRVLRFVAWAE
jgi:hypothetical protein